MWPEFGGLAIGRRSASVDTLRRIGLFGCGNALRRGNAIPTGDHDRIVPLPPTDSNHILSCAILTETFASLEPGDYNQIKGRLLSQALVAQLDRAAVS